MPNNNNGLQDIINALSDIEQTAETNSIGKMIASGIGVGIEQNSYLAVTAMENVYVQLETLYKNAEKNAQALEKKRHKRTYENLKNSLELNLITEKEYYEKLKEFRDRNFSQGSDDWYKYTEEIIFYNKRLADETEKQQEKIASVRDKLLTQIKSIRDELSQNLKPDDDWFSQNTITFKNMGKWGSDLRYTASDISGFEKELDVLSRYRNAILALKDLGNIPDGVFSDIAKMDVSEGLSAALAILNAEPSKRERFISGYNSVNSLADSIATELMPVLGKADIEKAGNDAAAAFNEAFFDTESGDKSAFISMLEESFASVPESYYTLGGDSAAAFKDGFMQTLPEVMSYIQGFVQSSIESIVSGMGSAYTGQMMATAAGNTYNNKYVFNSSRDTTTQQLFAAQRASTLSRLRGANL